MSELSPISRCPLVAVVALTSQIAAAQSRSTAGGTTQSGTRFLNPDGLNKPAGYTHVVVTEPRKLVYISGQLAWDEKREIVGKGDFRAQVTKALENLKVALTETGATMEDLVKVNITW